MRGISILEVSVHISNSVSKRKKLTEPPQENTVTRLLCEPQKTFQGSWVKHKNLSTRRIDVLWASHCHRYSSGWWIAWSNYRSQRPMGDPKIKYRICRKLGPWPSETKLQESTSQHISAAQHLSTLNHSACSVHDHGDDSSQSSPCQNVCSLSSGGIIGTWDQR